VKLSMFNCKFFVSFFKFSSLFENSVKEKSSIKNHERKNFFVIFYVRRYYSHN
jgi:hypothetical protein